ncbi:MAG: hypothetical protein FWG10_09700 [Eubacteriaceae bacterium]|nr:hypothetical protein [Eubacteriaceae bacterium]
MKLKFNLVTSKKKCLAMSAVFAVIFVLLSLFPGLNAGIEFKGGSALVFDLNSSVSQEEIKALVDKIDSEAYIAISGAEKNIAFINSRIVFTDAQNKGLVLLFSERYGASNVKLLSFKKVPAKTAKTNLRNSLLALAAAVACVGIYTAIRFGLPIALCSVVAILFDIAVVCGMSAVFGFQATSAFVVALLAVICYSVFSSIGFFSKIAEKRKKNMRTQSELDDLAESCMGLNLKWAGYCSVCLLITFGAVLALVPSSAMQPLLQIIIGVMSSFCSSVFIAPAVWHSIVANGIAKLVKK